MASSDQLLPMEARLVPKLPEDGLWQFEPKWDGFRCLAFKRGEKVELRSKSGKTLARYFPEIARGFAELKSSDFVLDGELIIPVGSSLSFDALQMRLHPAHSRVVKLARETPALFMAFDMLADGSKDLSSRPLGERRRALESLYRREKQPPIMRLSPYSRDLSKARRWLGKAGGGALDGVVAKSLRDPYKPGERAMLKVKCLRTADCVIGGFRYATDSDQVGSMLLGLYNADGLLDHVGFSSGIADVERPRLTRMFERLRGGPGFTGKAPGGPSRWSTDRSTDWQPLKTKLVAEVQYDQVTGDRFRHGTRFLRWRPDKSPRQCSVSQLKQEERPAKLLAALQ
jgi:ATP-dependent DNA ligase